MNPLQIAFIIATIALLTYLLYDGIVTGRVKNNFVLFDKRKQPFSYWFSIIGTALVTLFLLIMLLVKIGWFETPTDMRLLQSLEHNGVTYNMYYDSPCGGFGDFLWAVFKVEGIENPTELNMPCTTKTISSEIGENYNGVTLLLSNYSEDGNDTQDPKIEIMNDRYLVFVRSGLKYGLYDTTTGETLVNHWSPWHDHEYSDTDLSYSKWVRENIDGEISRIIESNDSPMPQ